MKKVFIAISILAVVYLLLQSGLTKDISLAPFYSSFTSVNETNTREQALQEEFQTALQAVQDENKALKASLAQAKDLINSLQIEVTEVKLASVKSSSTGSGSIKDPDIAPQNELPHAVNITSLPNQAEAQSNKRLQQQAMLRNLSQRMELAALSSLTK